MTPSALVADADLEQHAQSLLQTLHRKLTSTQRLQTLDQARQALERLLSSTHTPEEAEVRGIIQLLLDVIEQGPNDSRRIAMQCISSALSLENPLVISSVERKRLLNALIVCVQNNLRTARNATAATVPEHLSASSLRTATSALKVTLSILNADQAHSDTSSLASLLPSEIHNLVELVLSSVFVGLGVGIGAHTSRPSLNSSVFQSGVLSHTSVHGSSNSAGQRSASRFGIRSHSSFSNLVSTPGISDSESVYSYAGTDTSVLDEDSETGLDTSMIPHQNQHSNENSMGISKQDRLSDERDRKQASASKALRQNALYCLMALNRLNAKALYGFWPSLMPDRPVLSTTSPLTSSSQRQPNQNVSLFTLAESDPSLSVRLAAVEAIEQIFSAGQPHLSIAQQRSERLSAYTSLSSRLATMICDTRSHILHLLQRAALPHALPSSSLATTDKLATPAQTMPSSLLQALLRLVKTFAVSTAKAKLHQSNSQVLQTVVFKFCTHPDPQISSHAHEAISALVLHSLHGDGSAQVTALPNHVEVTSVLISKLSNKSELPEARIQAWRTLTVYAETQLFTFHPDIVTNMLQLAEQVVTQTPTSEAQEKATVAQFYVAIAKTFASVMCSPTTPERKTETYPYVKSKTWTSIWEHLVKDGSAEFQTILTDALPSIVKINQSIHGSFGKAELDAVMTQLEFWQNQVADDKVRAGSIRALGHLATVVKGEDSNDLQRQANDDSSGFDYHLIATTLAANSRQSFDLLLKSSKEKPPPLEDRSQLVRQRTSWALANLLESIRLIGSRSDFDISTWKQLSEILIRVADKDEEAVCIGALRGCGILLVLSRQVSDGKDLLRQNGKTIMDLVQVICSALDCNQKPIRSPKLRWNAANALLRAIKDTLLIRWLLETTNNDQNHHAAVERMISVLCSSLTAKVFKIKMAAGEALLAIGTSGVDKSRYDYDGIQKAVMDANESIEQEIETAQFKEASLYAADCRKLLDRLGQVFFP